MQEYLEKLCKEWAEKHNFSGVCRLRVGKEQSFCEAYGYANRAFHIPNRTDTRFDICLLYTSDAADE